MGGIALALRDCAKVDRDVPTDLQRLLERLNNKKIALTVRSPSSIKICRNGRNSD